MKLKIVSWNINSVRKRKEAMRRFVRKYDPHVLCLQETKVRDEQFPQSWFHEWGFAHVAIDGQKSYNGVAIISRLPLSRVRRKNWCGRLERRHIYTRLPGNLELHNLYVPAGGDIPDPVRNEKFAYKLEFLRDIAKWFRRRRRFGNRSILVGDLNVAPHENDVWSHERLINVVTHTPVEVSALEKLLSSQDWTDAIRLFTPESKKLYSWWSYRAPDWRKVNKGRRLDHAWITPPLGKNLMAAEVIQPPPGVETTLRPRPAVDHPRDLALLVCPRERSHRLPQLGETPVHPLARDFGVDLVAKGVAHLGEGVGAAVLVKLVGSEFAERFAAQTGDLVQKVLEGCGSFKTSRNALFYSKISFYAV